MKKIKQNNSVGYNNPEQFLKNNGEIFDKS